MTLPSSTASQAASSDDMVVWPPWPQDVPAETLAELKKTRQAISSVYNAANTSASVNLSLHRVVAVAVGFCGTYAVVMAIVQLYNPGWKESAEIELFFAGVAALAVIVGLVFRFMKEWLLRRHRAERCRFLKFNFLLQVALDQPAPALLLQHAQKFREEAHRLGRLKRFQMEQWLEDEEVPQSAPAAPATEGSLTDLRVLAEHYLDNRLTAQSQYFLKQSHRDTQWNWLTANLGPMLFGGSICFAFVHFAIEHRGPQFAGASRFFIFLAATLPVIGAGIRALRGISESSRNALRFKAKYNALTDLMKDLKKDLSGQTRAEDIVQLLWKGEQILEGEHREWLRLMIETEWIG